MKYKGKELPCVECGGQCCKYAPIEMAVWEKVKDKAPADAVLDVRWKGKKREAVIAMKPYSDGECVFLKDGRCSVYTYRPTACRAMGVKFPCAYVDPEAARKMTSQMVAKGHKFVCEDYGVKVTI